MKTEANNHNLTARIQYCLACLEKNMPEVAAKMSWHDCLVSMSNNMKLTAGVCKYYRAEDKFKVVFSESLFATLPEMDKTSVVAHELAHVVAFRLGIAKNHDHNWKRLCVAMGGDGERCIEVASPIQRNNVKRWVLSNREKECRVSIHTKKSAENLLIVFPNKMVLIGVINVNKTVKTYNWVHTVHPDVKTLEVLKKDAGWELVA
jgi:predicted SprT family Zn-dependent metalloprotease